MTKSIILLSGGLDSAVSLAYSRDKYNITLALTFDYGQKALFSEAEASKKLADFYNVEHKLVQLPWLADITQTALVSDEDVPDMPIEDLDNIELAEQTAKSVWVPNRNGLFVNIAACYADAFGYDHIIIGVNFEEATTFKDNSKEFIEAINYSLGNSAANEVDVIAPLSNFGKEEIVRIGIESGLPFEYLRSCYYSAEKHCGNCESCSRLKRALLANGRADLIKLLF